MSIKNRYVNRSKISEAKFRELVRYFATDLDASQIAQLSGLNRNTVNRYLKAIRERIAQAEQAGDRSSAELEEARAALGQLEQLRSQLQQQAPQLLPSGPAPQAPTD